MTKELLDHLLQTGQITISEYAELLINFRLE